MARVRDWIVAVLTYPLTIWTAIFIAAWVVGAFLYVEFGGLWRTFMNEVAVQYGDWAIVAWAVPVFFYVLFWYAIGTSISARVNPELGGSSKRLGSDDRLGTDEFRVK